MRNIRYIIYLMYNLSILYKIYNMSYNPRHPNLFSLMFSWKSAEDD